MFINYLKIAIRNLKRNKLYGCITIGGLAIGLAVCILIFLYVQYELSFDRFNKNADRTYILMQHWHAYGQDHVYEVIHNGNLASQLKTNFTDVQKVARVFPSSYENSYFTDVLLNYGSKSIYDKNGYYTDPSIFSIFTIPLLKGNKKTGLSRPNTIFLSESVSHKLFGDKNPVGKTVNINVTNYEVTGVFKDLPPNSSFRPDYLISYVSQKYNKGGTTYILLKHKSDVALVNQQLTDYVKKNHPARQVVTDSSEVSGKITYSLTPLLNIHLQSGIINPQEPHEDLKYIYLFSGIALLILLIACFNYVNMVTARSIERAIETGVRKVVGAGRGQLICQFFCETLLLNLIALLLAIVLVTLFLPIFDQFVQQPVSFQYINHYWMFGLLGIILLLISVIGGSYPAIFLSSFPPASVLQGEIIHQSGITLREGLVVLQFAISALLIICTILLQEQMNYVQANRPGANTSHVIMIKNRGIENKDYESFKAELLRYPGIKSVTTTLNISGVRYLNGFNAGNIVGYYHKIIMSEFVGDYDFIPTFGLKIIKGRNFSKDHPSDENHAVIVNEAAVKKIGWKKPIGKRIKFGVLVFKDGKLQSFHYVDRFVIGVVKNFHYRSLRKEVSPAIIIPISEPNEFIAVRTGTGNITQTLNFIKKKWTSFVPDHPLDYTFLSAVFAAMYRSDYLLGKIFKAFALLAIVIACLGLFGLATFSAEQRTKEIGIRKVLGASVSGIVALLSKDFLKLVGIGFLIAIPIAWYVMHRWLQNFVYHIHIGIGVFLLAGVLAMVIALATVSWQAIRAALANPVDSLRNE